MNKTAVFITFVALAAVGLIGTVVLIIHRPDATATFTSLLITVLGLATTAAGTFYALGKQNEKLDTIKTQTNGNLSAKEEENQRLTNIIIAAGLSPTLTTEEIAIVSAAEPRAPGSHASSAPIQ